MRQKACHFITHIQKHNTYTHTKAKHPEMTALIYTRTCASAFTRHDCKEREGGGRRQSRLSTRDDKIHIITHNDVNIVIIEHKNKAIER